MSESRQGIPVWTWYNGQFLFQFDEQLQTNPNKTISEFFNDFKISQNLQDKTFIKLRIKGQSFCLCTD